MSTRLDEDLPGVAAGLAATARLHALGDLGEPLDEGLEREGLGEAGEEAAIGGVGGILGRGDLGLLRLRNLGLLGLGVFGTGAGLGSSARLSRSRGGVGDGRLLRLLGLLRLLRLLRGGGGLRSSAGIARGDLGEGGELRASGGLGSVAGLGDRRGAGDRRLGGDAGRGGDGREDASARGDGGLRGDRDGRVDGGLGLAGGRRLRAGAVQRRAGDDVVLEVAVVRAEENTGVLGSVELRAGNTLRLVGARARDLDVHALGVSLGAIGLASAVQGNDLVAEDVVARREGLGHGGDPRVVVGDHGDGGPLLRLSIVARLVDLDPLQRLLVRLGAVAAAVGDVGEHGAHVAVGPLGPLELDAAARGDGRGGGGGLGGDVADDVGGAEVVGLHEAVVQVLGVPARGVGGRLPVLDHVVVVEEEAAIVGAVGDEAGHRAVGEGGGGQAPDESELGGEGHLERSVGSDKECLAIS